MSVFLSLRIKIFKDILKMFLKNYSQAYLTIDIFLSVHYYVHIT